MADTTVVERIKALIAASQPYAPGGSKKFRVNNNSGKLFCEFYLRDRSKREELENILEGFKDLVEGYRISEYSQGNEARDAIARSCFEKLQSIAEIDIERVLDRASQSQDLEQVYAFSIWLDPAQGGWTYLLRSESGFRKSLSEKQSGQSARHYQTKRAIEYFRFYDYSTASFDPSEDLSRHLYETAERSFSEYQRLGERFLLSHSPHEFELITDAVARALRNTIKKAKSKLHTTEDFISYIQYSDESDLSEYRAVRRTLDIDEIAKNMTALYGDLIEK